MTTTMCLSGGALFKAGLNVNTALATTGGDNIDMVINQAESTINTITRTDYTKKYAGLSNNVKKILEQVCQDLTAIDLIKYDMSGYTDRVEAEDMINVLRDAALRGLSILKDMKTTDFINGT